MPQVLPSFELLERRALLAGDDAAFVCALQEAEDFKTNFQQQHEEICKLEEIGDSSAKKVDSILRPSGTSKIDHYPESKGWFGDLWDHFLSMLGW